MQIQEAIITAQGIFFYHDGAKYEGEFEDDRKHGPGTIYHVNGDVFAEVWNNGECVKSTQIKRPAGGKTTTSGRRPPTKRTPSKPKAPSPDARPEYL